MQNECPADVEEECKVAAVGRALTLLEAFRLGEATLPLAELSRRSGLHKSTVLRLARTLSFSQFLVQSDSGEWRLGPACGWLGARYHAAFDVNNVVEPTLHQLVQLTGGSASFYVREGSSRSCVARIEGPASVRHAIRIGERLPLDRGSPGRVILAFSGESGEPYESIRERGFHVTHGERAAGISSLAAPVFGLGWRLLGCLCISGPSTRLSGDKIDAHVRAVVRAANELSYMLAGVRSHETPRAVSRWHPG